MAPSYELFYKPTCPFCIKVLNFMNAHGIELPLRDVSADTEAHDTLVRVGGKGQVPCLFIDGTPLYESGDIITYLAEHVAHVDAGKADEMSGDGSCSDGACSIF